MRTRRAKVKRMRHPRMAAWLDEAVGSPDVWGKPIVMDRAMTIEAFDDAIAEMQKAPSYQYSPDVYQMWIAGLWL